MVSLKARGDLCLCGGGGVTTDGLIAMLGSDKTYKTGIGPGKNSRNLSLETTKGTSLLALGRKKAAFLIP